MKNFNIKQLTASQRRVDTYLKKISLRFFLALMFVFTLQAVSYAATTDGTALEKIQAIGTVGGTMGLASMLAIGNIDDVPDRDVAGEAISYKVWLVHLSQIDDTLPFPTPSPARDLSAIPLKPGEKMIYFEAHDIPEHNSSGERGDLTISGTNTFSIIMGGIREQLLNFIEQYAGGKFLIIFQECGKTEKYILGTPCKPMVLRAYSLSNNKESRSVSFTFENKSIIQFFKYTGGITAAEPVTLAAGATALAVQSGVDTYMIANGTSSAAAIATVTGLTSSDIGRIITLKGLGTTYPSTIADNTAFILVGGATWTARTGSALTLRVHDEDTLIEVSRVQTS